MSSPRWLVLGGALALLATACGSDEPCEHRFGRYDVIWKSHAGDCAREQLPEVWYIEPEGTLGCSSTRVDGCELELTPESCAVTTDGPALSGMLHLDSKGEYEGEVSLMVVANFVVQCRATGEIRLVAADGEAP